MKKFIIAFLVVMLILAVGAPVLAKSSLQFNSTKIYWNSSYQLAVEGYFENDGDKTIAGITYFYLAIYYKYGSQYYLLTKGAWVNDPDLMAVVIEPGGRSTWTFYLNTNIHPDFYYWTDDWKLEYNYLK